MAEESDNTVDASETEVSNIKENQTKKEEKSLAEEFSKAFKEDDYE